MQGNASAMRATAGPPDFLFVMLSLETHRLLRHGAALRFQERL
jgi:hypothetical protein